MKKGWMWGSLVLAVFAAAGGAVPAMAGMNVNVNVGLPVVAVPEPPEMIMVPGSPVYFAPRVEADLFFYQGGWFTRHGDRWFRGRSYEGPWTVVGPRAVPAPLVRVPRGYRTMYVREEHIPYGQFKKHWRRHGDDRRWGREDRREENHEWKEHDRGHGGRGRGHD